MRHFDPFYLVAGLWIGGIASFGYSVWAPLAASAESARRERTGAVQVLARQERTEATLFRADKLNYLQRSAR